MDEIKKINAISSKAFYEEYLIPRVPVVIRNVAPWAALTTWSLEMFRQRFADRTIPLLGELKNMGEFINEVECSTEENPVPYLKELPLAEYFPELMKDLEPTATAMTPNWLANNLIPKKMGTRDGFCELFIGGPGSGFFMLHYDAHYVNTFITQIQGAKDFTIVAPDDTPNVYPREDRPNMSQLKDLSNVNLQQFPLYENANPTNVRVEPGETIFVPWGYWHASRIVAPSIAVAISTANAENWGLFLEDRSYSENTIKKIVKKSIFKLAGVSEKISAPFSQ
ncbi:MAG: cupin-like domain-containing protein [Sneathiella sp.]|uniref:cupin-like domain-containing protein n=1 Tax=Sneathiella sp. TaxID=1964365 RepID=UPI00300348B5